MELPAGSFTLGNPEVSSWMPGGKQQEAVESRWNTRDLTSDPVGSRHGILCHAARDRGINRDVPQDPT